MLPQAQDFLTSQHVPFDQPIGALLVLALIVLAVSGLLFESGLPRSVRVRLGGGSASLPRRVATAGQQG